MKKEKILILDFGAQYSQLIARRVRDLHVYCEILPYNTPAEEIRQKDYMGIVLSGGPDSVYDDEALRCDPNIFTLGIPVLGICYGAQLMAYMLGGEVKSSSVKEYGNTPVRLMGGKLFAGLKASVNCWMSHTVYIETPPEGFKITAKTDVCPVASMADEQRKLYALQFHPEVQHTEQGTEILHNFLFLICGCAGDWAMSSFAADAIENIRQEVGDKRVVCALSGGVDSSVSAVIVNKAVGKQLTCIFVDHGLLRKGEADQVEKVFREQFDIELIRIDAQDRFLDKLAGVTDPERKRKIIGEEFIRVFEEEAAKIGHVDYLCQGTIYPDVVESGIGNAAVIKSHHNVGGLPENVSLKLIEPLRELFKDEVRQVGIELGLPSYLVWRQPFPGPGLGIRVLGEITRDKLNVLREADAIFREEISLAGLDRSINQYFAILTGVHSVGVMGDMRTYDYTIALRGVTTTDFMTADWAKIPYDVLGKASSRIVNEVGSVNRIVYDITSKPPATIEWE